MTGRPSKLTTELADAIAATIRKPTPATLAAQKHGVARTTYHRWMREGLADDASELLRYFRHVIDEALADAADTLLAPLREALVDGSTEQAKYLLSHMFPDEFGNRQTVTHEGRIDSSVDFDLPAGAGDAAAAFVRSLGDEADAA